MSQLFHTSSSSSLFFCFSLFFIFIGSINGAGLDNNQTYQNCRVDTCGGVNISYPFWRLGGAASSQQQYCGYPQFGINCSGTGPYPIILLPGNAYYVKTIDYVTHSISLVDIDAAYQTCPRVRHGIDIQSLPLNFTAGLNTNLSFHFNCTRIPSYATRIPCLSNRTHQACVYEVGTEKDEFDWNRYCADQVNTTVLSAAINPPRGGGGLDALFGTALTGGFVLNWGMEDGCDKCEASGGLCGHNIQTSRFMCFCNDGTSTPLHCGGVFNEGCVRLARFWSLGLLKFVFLCVGVCVCERELY